MKLCPFCAEEIQDAAIKCKHCGSMLHPATPPPLPPNSIPSAAKPTIPWGYRTSTILTLGFVVGPLVLFMLPAVWMNPHLDRRAKFTWSTGIVLFSALCVVIAVWSIRKLIEYYQLLLTM